MPEQQRLHKVESNVRFIRESVTAVNPKNAFFENYEEMIKWYMVVILFGAVMVFYFFIS